MLEATRIYKNASDEEIRIDTITLLAKRDNICIGAMGDMQSGHTYSRNVNITRLYSSADRVVASIILMGSFDSVETSSGSFLLASWISPATDLDMSDLPVVGDTV
jgi:hypothetical protein